MKKHYIAPQSIFLDIQENRFLLIGSNDNYAESKYFKPNKKDEDALDNEDDGDDFTDDSDDVFSGWD
jgi:hypothetical protein